MVNMEFLKSITADDLNTVLDAEISANEAQTEDAQHIVGWLADELPELIHFAQDCVGRYFEEPPEQDDPTASLIVMNTAITLGALCRAIEAKSLPPLD